jgi:hypothetical protein
VIELIGGMVSDLDCLLRNGINIIHYSYGDVSNQARVVSHHRLSQLTARYPDQLSLEAWLSALTALPQDVFLFFKTRENSPMGAKLSVYAVLVEHLFSAGALTVMSS